MANRQIQIQEMIRLFKKEKGKEEWTSEEVAEFMVSKGWTLPPPTSPLKRLAKEISDAAREEIRYDKVTGLPYRANHVVITKQGKVQYSLWYDIDTAPRAAMDKSLKARREQMVGDALQLTRDADHWNRVNPNEVPIQLPLDFGPDVEWRNNAPEGGKKAS